jgi:nucleotide-binding universal stress UspA family protein
MDSSISGAAHVTETLPTHGRPHVAAPVRIILLATDLGPASSAAVDEAIDLAQRLRSEVLVVSVIDPANLRLPGGGMASRVDQVRDERSRLAAAFAARGRSAGVPVRFLIWEGEPGDGILDAAAAEGADMIVVGTHGRRGLGRLLLGSVSEYVIRHANVPVLVVRPRASTS